MIDITPLDVEESDGAIESIHIGLDIETTCYLSNFLNRFHVKGTRKYDAKSKQIAKQLAVKLDEFLKRNAIVTVDDKIEWENTK